MSIVELYRHLLGEGVEVGPVMIARAELARLVTTNNILQCRSDHEVLLLESKLLALEEIVVRVENPTDVLGQVAVEHSLNVITVVD